MPTNEKVEIKQIVLSLGGGKTLELSLGQTESLCDALEDLLGRPKTITMPISVPVIEHPWRYPWYGTGVDSIGSWEVTSEDTDTPVLKCSYSSGQGEESV